MLRFEAAVRLEERVEAAVAAKDWEAGYLVYTQIKVGFSCIGLVFLRNTLKDFLHLKKYIYIFTKKSVLRGFLIAF